MIIKLYADLVELKLRATTETEAAEWGCALIPVRYRAGVIAELASRQTA